MSAEVKILENVLYKIWEEQKFTSPLSTAQGEPITILNAGALNSDNAGPDFKNARVKIGNLTFVGDIEIDRFYSDWKNHGHNIDNRYNKVLLHIYAFRKGKYDYVYTRDGRKIPSVCIFDKIENGRLEQPDTDERMELANHKNRLKCAELNSSLSRDSKVEILSRLGAERLKKKSYKMFERLKEIQFLNELGIKEPVVNYDLTEKFHEKKFKYSDFKSKEIWMQLLYEFVLEALGYTKNKMQMIELAQAADIKFLSKIENDGVILEKFEAALLKISGLAQSTDTVVDADSIEYLKRIELHWNSIKPFYDGKYLDETIWQFFKIRPHNFPTVRIAASARFVKAILYENLIENLIDKIKGIHQTKILHKSLRSVLAWPADGYWKNHFIFDQKKEEGMRFYIGTGRVDDIIINVLLPYFTLYFQIYNKPKIVDKIEKLYGVIEQQIDNQIVLNVAEALNMQESAKYSLISQGMIQLFRIYCSKNKCLECEIGAQIFN